MREITLKAFAKVNVCLDIVGKNENGYHLLDTVMQSVDLYDIVSISLNNSGKIFVSCSNKSICAKDNIVYSAAEKFIKYLGATTGVDIFIEKNIPLCGGLGGGSADAAAVIKGLNILMSYPFNEQQLKDICLELGADVPFCLVGSTKRCTGIGEIMTDTDLLDFGSFLLINCGKKESTKSMYSIVDSSENISRPKVDQLVKAIKNKDMEAFKKNAVNVFTGCYKTDKVKQDILDCGGDFLCLSGSGSYGFSFFENRQDACACAKKLDQKGYSVFVCSPVDKGSEIVSVVE